MNPVVFATSGEEKQNAAGRKGCEGVGGDVVTVCCGAAEKTPAWNVPRGNGFSCIQRWCDEVL